MNLDGIVQGQSPDERRPGTETAFEGAQNGARRLLVVSACMPPPPLPPPATGGMSAASSPIRAGVKTTSVSASMSPTVLPAPKMPPWSRLRGSCAGEGRLVAESAVTIVSSLEEIRDQSCQRLTQPSMGTLVKMHAIGRVSGSELAGIEERRVGLARELLVVACELP